MSREGFWAPPGSFTFYRCDKPEACLPGVNGSRTVCATGYTGVVCDVCADGFFEQFDRYGSGPGAWVLVRQRLFRAPHLLAGSRCPCPCTLPQQMCTLPQGPRQLRGSYAGHRVRVGGGGLRRVPHSQRAAGGPHQAGGVAVSGDRQRQHVLRRAMVSG